VDHESHLLESPLKAQVMAMAEIVEHTLCGPANNDMHACVDEGICDSDLVVYLAILGELEEYTCVGTQVYKECEN